MWILELACCWGLPVGRAFTPARIGGLADLSLGSVGECYVRLVLRLSIAKP